MVRIKLYSLSHFNEIVGLKWLTGSLSTCTVIEIVLLRFDYWPELYENDKFVIITEHGNIK